MAHPQHWRSTVHLSIEEIFQDTLVTKLLEKSNLTRAQFETLLLDQLGSEIANKKLTREEMTELRRPNLKISRGAFNRTLKQARSNISDSIYTVLLLGYSGLLESPSLAPYVEASERLRVLSLRLRDSSLLERDEQRRILESVMGDLEDASAALKGRNRDV